jgi:CheY-like chemotaxis protein
MRSKPRVLVVDDEQIVATTLSMVLNSNGFEAVAAFSGREALALAHTSHFDVLVADVMMEPMSGLQTAIAFRNANPASHVFLFTGAEEAARLILDTANTGYDFQIFPKPLHPLQIIGALREALSTSDTAPNKRP